MDTEDIVLIYNMPGDKSSFKEKKELLYPVDFE